MSDQTPKPSQKLADQDPLEAEILRREAAQGGNSETWLQYQARASQNIAPRPYLDSYQLQDWAEERLGRLEERLSIVEKWLGLTATACIVFIFIVVGLVWRLL